MVYNIGKVTDVRIKTIVINKIKMYGRVSIMCEFNCVLNRNI